MTRVFHPRKMMQQPAHAKTDIRNWTRLELRQWLAEQSEEDPKIQPYRADQVFYWLYKRLVQDFSEMANIGKATRTLLETHFRIGRLGREQVQRSRDGSLKYRLMLEDKKFVETVLMPHADHHTVCISSQVGCGMGCDFCMTGKMGLIRNLEVSEIVNQVLEARQDLPEGAKLRNIVFMGMGEPFHNYKNVMRALEIFTDDHGFNYSQRRITVSTSGLIPKIRRFGKEEIKANLAVSLNSVNDSVRSALMPVNKAYNLEQLVEACREYPLESHKRITFEYILIRDLTDSLEDARGLIRLLHGVKFKVNLIPFNETPGSHYQRPDWPRVEAFQQYLLDRGVLVTLRISKGQDISGACGQLVVQEQIPA